MGLTADYKLQEKKVNFLRYNRKLHKMKQKQKKKSLYQLWVMNSIKQYIFN